MAKKANRRNGKAKSRKMNGTVVAMNRRYANQETSHKHRCDRRSKDARKSWQRDHECE